MTDEEAEEIVNRAFENLLVEVREIDPGPQDDPLFTRQALRNEDLPEL